VNRIWRIRDPHRELCRSLNQSLGISSITAQLLANRGIRDEKEARHFLYGDIASCHDPFLLKDMEKAVMRVRRAIEKKEHILIYGDYDVDGITAAALLSRVLASLKAKSTNYIPNRLSEGYGLNTDAVKSAHGKKASLIITVDCGISAKEEVKLANTLGMDVIITDHHKVKAESLPEAYAIINPHQPSCPYPFKGLSGVGLAYKLAGALTAGTPFSAGEHLDLVALGTICDVSAQKGENRILTKCGLKKLKDTGKAGIKALIEASGIKGKNISASNVGFILGPRINAMGRVGSPEVALKLLLTRDRDEAGRLAGILDSENRKRQKIERLVLGTAIEKVEREVNFKKSRVIVLSSTNWHAGVIGIVASRIADKYYRPTIMISIDGERGRGSGRSIDSFHLFDAINSCKKHLLDFGGHKAACGLAIDTKNILSFTDEINRVAKDAISERDLCPVLDIDMEVGLSDLTEGLIEEIGLLAPFGPENPRPIFSSKSVHLRSVPRRIGKGGFKMWVTDEKVTCEAISFRAENMAAPSGDSTIHLAYAPSINTWQGVSTLQLDLKDLKLTA